MTKCKYKTTDPKDSIDNCQELQANIKLDAATELVGEHGGHAGDPHRVLLAQPRETQVSHHSWCWSRGEHQWPGGLEGGPGLALTSPRASNWQTCQLAKMCAHSCLHHAHKLPK